MTLCALVVIPTEGKPICEDAEGTSTRAPGTTGGTYDDKGAKVQSWEVWALLIPMPLQASRKELTDALSSHYGSPGRLANYRREFDKTVRKRGEDLSNFAITLETLAVKAFGNMGQTARLRLIRDRFIDGHESCDLRRYLDCVPPDTPLRDIVDRCRVWESHADTEVRRISKPMPEPVYPTYVVKQPDYETEPVCVIRAKNC